MLNNVFFMWSHTGIYLDHALLAIDLLHLGMGDLSPLCIQFVKETQEGVAKEIPDAFLVIQGRQD